MGVCVVFTGDAHGQSVRQVGRQPREEHTGGRTGRGEVRSMMLRARAMWDGLGTREGAGGVASTGRSPARVSKTASASWRCCS